MSVWRIKCIDLSFNDVLGELNFVDKLAVEVVCLPQFSPFVCFLRLSAYCVFKYLLNYNLCIFSFHDILYAKRVEKNSASKLSNGNEADIEFNQQIGQKITPQHCGK